MIKRAYGKVAMGRSSVFEWHKKKKEFSSTTFWTDPVPSQTAML